MSKILKFSLFGGVDTKIAGEVLPAPKLQVAQNVWSKETGSLQRRPGRTALVNLDQDGNLLSGWLATATYQGRLVGFNSTGILEYLEGDGRWSNRGDATSWRETTMPITAPTPAAPATTIGKNCSDSAVVNGWKLYAYDLYETSGANVVTTLRLTLFDSKGGRYKTDYSLSTFTGAARTSAVRVLAFGGKFYVLYNELGNLARLDCFIIDPTSAATIAASFAGAATNLTTALANPGAFDAEVNQTYGPFVAFPAPAGGFLITFGFVNTVGVLVSTSTTATGANDAVKVAVDVVGPSTHAIVYSKGLLADCFACLRSFNGTTWSAIQTSAAMEGALTNPIGHLVCRFDSLTQLRVFFDGDVNVTATCVKQRTYTTAGVVSAALTAMPHSNLASKPFFVGGQMHVWVASFGIQATAFLLRVDTTSVLLLAGVANQGIHATVLTSQVPRISNDSAKYFLPNFVYTRKSPRTFDGRGVLDLTGNVVAMREVAIDTASLDSHVCVEDGQSLLVPSAFLGYFDGVSITEVGFLQYVDGLIGSGVNGAGNLKHSADYYFRVVMEWTNAQGEREQGADSGPFKVTTGAGTGADDFTITLSIPTLPWTRKQDHNAGLAGTLRTNLVFAVYRTVGNPSSADDPHYRVGSVKNSVLADTVSFADTTSDATVITKEQLYADTEISNVGPPPGYVLATGNGRVFVSGLPDDPSLIVYSKQRPHGVPLAFNSILQIQAPVDAGPIVSVAVLDEQVVAFTGSTVYRVVGDGLNNTGVGAGYAPPVVVIDADGGASSHRGTSVTAIGLVYQSTRGIMLFGPSLQGSYLGAALENAGVLGPVSGITTDPANQLIHVAFSTQTGVFDYYHKQWYVWTHHSDGPICLWNGAVAALQSDAVQYGDPAVWQDGGVDYTASIMLGWQRSPTGMLGDVSWRRVALVGLSLAAHYLDVRLAQDYDAATTQTADETIATAGVLRRRLRVARQKANSIQVTIRDALLDAYGGDVVQATAGWRLFELDLEVTVRSGRPSARRVANLGGG